MTGSTNIVVDQTDNCEMEKKHENITTKTEEIEDLEMTHGELIEKCVGSFHRWQLMVCLTVFLVNFPLVWHEMVQIFFAPTLQGYHCADPDNTTARCSAECKRIEFDEHNIKWSTREQWMLICDYQWLAPFSQTILMFGVLFGNVVFGLASDEFGRRKPLLCAVCLQIVSSLSLVWIPWYWMFLLIRFCIGVSTGGTQLIAFCIVMEVVGREHRSALGVLFQIFYYLGHALLGVIGYCIREWNYIQLTISLPSLLLLSFFLVLPESPRWLLTRHHLEEAIIVLEKGAKCNKMPTEHIRDTITAKLGSTPDIHSNLFDLVKTPNLRAKTLCICCNWVVLGVSFFGIAHYMGQIGGNMFVNTIITGLVQIPGNWIIIPLMSKFGRKYTLIGTYLFCALPLFLIPVVPAHPPWAHTTLGLIGMMGISLSFATMFVFSGELYPTVVRNAGMGVSSLFAKVGAMCAPFINNLEVVHAAIPPIVYGIGPILACIACIRLPETVDSIVPDTIEEAEEFGKKTS